MERIDRTSAGVVKAALDRQPLTEGKVAFAWAVAAGPALARAGSIRWAEGTLTVIAKSDVWLRELERARPMILSRLRYLVGPDAVRHAHIVGSARESPFGNRRP